MTGLPTEFPDADGSVALKYDDRDELALIANNALDRCNTLRATLVEIHPIAVCIAIDATANPIDREWAAQIVEMIDAALGGSR